MLVTKRDCSPSSYYITFLPNVYIHLAGKTPSWLVDHEPSQSSLFKTMHLKVLSVKWLLFCSVSWCVTSHWRHNDRDGVWNHQPHDCLLNCLFRSKKTSKLRVTGLCAGNSPVADEFPAQRAGDAENVSIWWRYHESVISRCAWHTGVISEL